ncbi:transcriptional regulator, LacI family [Rhizobium sp. NFR07]|uniref:LacI family DNA-binding transcriptional regulator n=1 Tax=Rhizobium sp. NFR07 TaxID=1566262 RepID=UPI0008E9FF41|nr:LacI family DNA-binding transcriptional regulator [Rhizobium sp. NFR07]SFA74753.1 transcriptional regulator, LacI family [Rhizobium sp. NFR07]
MRPKNKVTIQAVADAVGLSKYAVSRSLAGKSGVSEETRRRIADAAKSLGYAKAITRLNAARDIAVVFYDQDPVNSELNIQMQAGIQQEAERVGVGVRVRWTHSEEIVGELADTFSGLILVGPHSPAAVAGASLKGVPIVRLGFTTPLEQVDSVCGTDHESGQAIGKYLTSLGHRSIAFVFGRPIYRGRHDRYCGIREVVEQTDGAELTLMQFEDESGFADALQQVKSKGVSPTAFFCGHDGLALTVVSELLGQGYKIPEDVSVVGFGDFSAATQISPPLTTVKQEGREMGIAALRLLLSRIARPRTKDEPARMVRVISRLIERRSVAHLREKDQN